MIINPLTRYMELKDVKSASHPITMEPTPIPMSTAENIVEIAIPRRWGGTISKTIACIVGWEAPLPNPIRIAATTIPEALSHCERTINPMIRSTKPAVRIF